MIRDETQLLEEAAELFTHEKRLIKLAGKLAVFVGDTHGDLQATQAVLQKHLKPGNRVVFLGDYVDRGPHSLENIQYLLSKKLEFPEALFLLMGNHEGWKGCQFSPADFWGSLEPERGALYAETLAKLPLVVTTSNGIIALHGALPDVKKLEDINQIEFGGEAWRQITWGDWQERPGYLLGDDLFSARPQFGKDYFEALMRRFGRNVLIRSHQPNAKQFMFGGNCITIFTSSAYGYLLSQRSIAVVSLERQVKTGADIRIEAV